MERPARSVLHNRNYALLFWGDFVSKVGSLFFSLAVSFYILEITGNNALIQGTYLAVAGVVSLVFSPLGGVLADRMDKVKLIWGMDFVRGAVILAAGLLMLRFRGSVGVQLAVLFTVNVICNTAGAIFGPASGSIIRFLVKDDQTQQAMSYFTAAQSIESIAGTLAAGIFYAAFDIFWVFLFDGLSFLLSGVSELFIRCEKPQESAKMSLRAVMLDMGDGLKYLKGNRPLMAVLLVALGLNMFSSPMYANGVPYLCNVYLTSTAGRLGLFMTKELWYAVFEISISVGMLIVSLILGARAQREHCGRSIRRALALNGILMCVHLAAYELLVEWLRLPTAYALTLTVISLLIGALIGCINIPFSVALMRVTDSAMLGKVNGITVTLSSAFIPIGNMIGGALISLSGLGALYVYCTAGFLVMTLFALKSRPLASL